MNRLLAGLFWLILYLLIVILPLPVALLPPRPPERPFWVDFSVGLGFAGLMQIVVQFVLIARFGAITRPYGIDLIVQYHRQIGFLALALVCAHPAVLILQNPSLLKLISPYSPSWEGLSGLAALVSLLLVAGLSAGRRFFRLNYEAWRVTHTALGFSAIFFSLLHLFVIGAFTNSPAKRSFWIAAALAAAGVVAYLRILKPLAQKGRPYRVTGIEKERGANWMLSLAPDGHPGMGFEPGQFAWLKLGDSPFTVDEHPFSISSSAEASGRMEFAVKERGDFTGRIGQIPVGTRAYLDGPHGALSIDRYPAAGYVLIAGGIGVAPMLSILQSMADRQDVRPVLLIYGNRLWEKTAYREILDSLSSRMNLQVIYVVEEPEPDWQGESGLISLDLLQRRLPRERIKRACFLCGPNAMVAEVADILLDLGIERRLIIVETFDVV